MKNIKVFEEFNENTIPDSVRDKYNDLMKKNSDSIKIDTHLTKERWDKMLLQFNELPEDKKAEFIKRLKDFNLM